MTDDPRYEGADDSRREQKAAFTPIGLILLLVLLYAYEHLWR
jgi:hypothetical protein